MKLRREFYQRSALIVAQDLIGKKYLGEFDAAAHSYKGRTARTEIQFGAGGYAYVYQIYGKNFCFNVVANGENIPDAVLIRALAPTDGIDLMKIRRNKNNLRDLCSGPGKLAQALGITKNDYGADLCGNEIFIEDIGLAPEIAATKRINIDYAGDAAEYLWRFVCKKTPLVIGS